MRPLAAGSRLVVLDNVILTPQVAGVTTLTANNMVDALAGRCLPRGGHRVHGS